LFTYDLHHLRGEYRPGAGSRTAADRAPRGRRGEPGKDRSC
jgi:hypothetical protein